MRGITGDAVKYVGEPGFGSTPFILAETIKLYMAAARWLPRSDPANNQDFLPCAAQGAFGGIVRETDAPAVEEEGEGRPAVQQVIEGLGKIIVARQLVTLSLHPRS